MKNKYQSLSQLFVKIFAQLYPVPLILTINVFNFFIKKSNYCSENKGKILF